MIKPTQVKVKALRLEKQNLEFRSFLKNRADDDELDAQFLELHTELFATYDCSQCNNCCREFSVNIDSDEAESIAAFLGMTGSEFASKYLTEADPWTEKLVNPCPFLGDDGCQIQSCRPRVCEGFPFTDQPDRLSSMMSIIGHAEVCPIVFEILERLKVMYGFRHRN
jgi:Fe-S-cluster containining protein